MGRPSNERLEEMMNASWRDLTQSERRSATREMRRRVKDPDVLIFAEDLLRAHPGLSALEAWDKAKGLHETESRTPTPVIYGKDAVEPESEPVSADDSDAASDPWMQPLPDEWLDELPADEHHSPDSKAMGITAECRQHPGKWHRLACFATRKQAQTRAAAIRRNKKTWAGVDAHAIERDQRHETWISYQGDTK